MRALTILAAAAIATSFTSKFLNESTGVYNDGSNKGTQCMQALPLYFDMFPPGFSAAAKEAVVAATIDTVAKNDGHFVGGMYRSAGASLPLSVAALALALFAVTSRVLELKF